MTYDNQRFYRSGILFLILGQYSIPLKDFAFYFGVVLIMLYYLSVIAADQVSRHYTSRPTEPTFPKPNPPPAPPY